MTAENHSPPARSLRRTQCTNLWVVYNCALSEFLDRAQLYTTSGSGALRPAGGVLRTADDFRRFSICSNHHRGSYPSPALAYASYPFVDLPPGIILRCKLFPSDKFAEIRLYFFYEIAYNGAGDKSEFGGENMTAHMRLR